MKLSGAFLLLLLSTYAIGSAKTVTYTCTLSEDWGGDHYELKVPVDSIPTEHGTLRFLDDKDVPFWTIVVVGSTDDPAMISEYFGTGLVRDGKPIEVLFTVNWHSHGYRIRQTDSKTRKVVLSASGSCGLKT